MNPASIMESLPWIVVVGIVLTLIRGALLQLSAWQIKEYRVRRLLAAVDETYWRTQMTHPISLLKWLVAIIISYELITSQFVLATDPFVSIILATYFVLRGLGFLIELIRRSFPRPVPTVKAGLLFMAATLIVAAGSWWAWLSLDYLGATLMVLTTVGLLADRLVIIGVAASVIILKLPTRILKERIFARALSKRSSFTSLTVIGITGSYGKSSVKEFLTTILATSYEILKTPNNINSDIGIAKIILDKLTSHYQFFVAEMGAYQRGEIRKAASIAQPLIGILTGLNDQHIALFGSQHAISRAKYELLEALPADGIAVCNVDNIRVKHLYRKYPGPKLSYGFSIGAHVRATKFKHEPKGINITVSFQTKERVVHAPIFGKHNALNLVGAIAGALAAGMTFAKATKAAQRVKPPERTLQTCTGPNGSLVIDDSYSGNLDGVLAALDVLSHMPHQRKMVIMPSIIELGKQGDMAHALLGENAAAIADSVYVVDSNYRRQIMLSSKGNADKINFPSARQLRSQLQASLDESCAVLITGRLIGQYKRVYSYLTSARTDVITKTEQQ